MADDQCTTSVSGTYCIDLKYQGKNCISETVVIQQNRCVRSPFVCLWSSAFEKLLRYSGINKTYLAHGALMYARVHLCTREKFENQKCIRRNNDYISIMLKALFFPVYVRHFGS